MRRFVLALAGLLLALGAAGGAIAAAREPGVVELGGRVLVDQPATTPTGRASEPPTEPDPTEPAPAPGSVEPQPDRTPVTVPHEERVVPVPSPVDEDDDNDDEDDGSDDEDDEDDEDDD